ncbi:hypothetical protein M0812_00239 [Anaeramoeba flamelloides]|uniref:Uncharacterized protein n=1 Tax=Anaeramoeba flamelloides TaxID=1746091 RepID=A0AAV8A4T6_9EUKA|nr:hypothetical protein M0812_00239 [Anaeramoeba flamelloides]
MFNVYGVREYEAPVKKLFYHFSGYRSTTHLSYCRVSELNPRKPLARSCPYPKEISNFISQQSLFLVRNVNKMIPFTDHQGKRKLSLLQKSLKQFKRKQLNVMNRGQIKLNALQTKPPKSSKTNKNRKSNTRKTPSKTSIDKEKEKSQSKHKHKHKHRHKHKHKHNHRHRNKSKHKHKSRKKRNHKHSNQNEKENNLAIKNQITTKKTSIHLHNGSKKKKKNYKHICVTPKSNRKRKHKQVVFFSAKKKPRKNAAKILSKSDLQISQETAKIIENKTKELIKSIHKNDIFFNSQNISFQKLLNKDNKTNNNTTSKNFNDGFPSFLGEKVQKQMDPLSFMKQPTTNKQEIVKPIEGKESNQKNEPNEPNLPNSLNKESVCNKNVTNEQKTQTLLSKQTQIMNIENKNHLISNEKKNTTNNENKNLENNKIEKFFQEFNFFGGEKRKINNSKNEANNQTKPENKNDQEKEMNFYESKFDELPPIPSFSSSWFD